jgi:hypothetical protein
MNDQDLRQLVRQAIAKQMGTAHAHDTAATVAATASDVQFVPHTVQFGDHASHALYMQLINTDNACVIEPRVQCDHCGYCKSHGH